MVENTSILNNDKEPEPDKKDESQTSPEETTEKEFVWGDGLSVNVSPDQMNVKLEVDLEYSENYTPEDIVRFLEQQHNLHGINKEAVKSIFSEKKFNKEVMVAKGRFPKHGEDGKVKWEIDLSVLQGAKLVERAGRVDWKEQHHILQVDENQLMARMIDPTEGEPGENVYGLEIPANPGKEIKFPAGKGVRISEDGKELYSEIHGVVCREGDKVTVTQTLSVQGDVSFKTGNIEYEETVVISGGVLTDFKVRAGNDLHINGLVEGAELSAGGNIFINAGIQGGDKAHIKADGDVIAKFVNGGKIEAQGDVVIDGAVTNSRIKSLNRVLVSGNKAVIVGGHISAEKEIAATFIGSEIGVKTLVEIGEQVMKLKEERVVLEKKIKPLLENHRKMRDALQVIDKVKATGKLPPEKEALRLKLVRSGMQLQGEIKKKKSEIQSLDSQIKAGKKQQKGVVVRDTTWPGTIVQIMGVRYPIYAKNTKVIYALVGDSVELFAYKEGEEKKGKGGEQKSDKKK